MPHGNNCHDCGQELVMVDGRETDRGEDFLTCPSAHPGMWWWNGARNCGINQKRQISPLNDSQDVYGGYWIPREGSSVR